MDHQSNPPCPCWRCWAQDIFWVLVVPGAIIIALIGAAS